MAFSREDKKACDFRCRRWSVVAACAVLAAAIPASLGGCGGCRQDPEEAEKQRQQKLAEEKKKEQEKPKEDFELSPLTTLPGAGLPSDVGYKPGHWTGTTLKAKANNFDFLGDLEIVATEDGKPVLHQATPFALTTSREVQLAKGRKPKELQSVFFPPVDCERSLVSFRLDSRRGGRRVAEQTRRLGRMPSYQYHFVVLARSPENYGYLGRLASINPPADVYSNYASEPYYRIVRKTSESPVVLPPHGLMWTSIACILWDDADPAELDSDAQRNLLDWLHWGGQLIISGPDTLDTLKGSFLAPYLPATAAPGARQLTEEDFRPLYDWATRGNVDSDKNVGRPKLLSTLSGVRLDIHARGRPIPGSGDLLIERRVGRGRVVVSAFRLCGREMVHWQEGFDELLNAFLLGRPPRRFRRVEPELFEEDGVGWEMAWADGHSRIDAARICNLRYFTRDTGISLDAYAADVRRSPDARAATLPGTGVAAWNGFGPVPNAAREALLKAAQIEIPDRSFVLWAVAGYLAILVPANWIVFRLIRRVEWAWISAPLIAVVSTVVVVRMAELDIGFVRSETDIAVVEIQGDYPRAHVTRYTALYTSLGKSYDFRFDDAGALMHAFPTVHHAAGFRERESRDLYCRRGEGADISGYYVRSNSTGMVHSEQMVDLEGGLSLAATDDGRFTLTNHTGLALHDAGIIRKSDVAGGPEIIETAYLGRLEPDATVPLWFQQTAELPADYRCWQDQRRDPRLTGRGLQPGELDLSRLVALAQNTEDLQPGDVRLVAGLEQPLPGPTTDPPAQQVRRAALVVAHLRYGFGADPQPDVNTLAEDRPVGHVSNVPGTTESCPLLVVGHVSNVPGTMKSWPTYSADPDARRAPILDDIRP